MMVDMQQETLDDVLADYQQYISPSDSAWIDEQRLRIILALKYEDDRRSEVFERIANGLDKRLKKV